MDKKDEIKIQVICQEPVDELKTGVIKIGDKLGVFIEWNEAWRYSHSIRNITCKACWYLKDKLSYDQMIHIEKLADILSDSLIIASKEGRQIFKN